MSPWGKRKLSDATIREILRRIDRTTKDNRIQQFKAIAAEFKCSLSTIQRIHQGALLPKGIDK